MLPASPNELTCRNLWLGLTAGAVEMLLIKLRTIRRCAYDKSTARVYLLMTILNVHARYIISYVYCSVVCSNDVVIHTHGTPLMH